MDTTIYGTPDEWGSATFFYNAANIAETVTALKRESPEYADSYTADDCSEWRRMRQIDTAHAVYQENIRKPNFMVFRVDGDQYAPIHATQSKTEAGALALYADA